VFRIAIPSVPVCSAAPLLPFAMVLRVTEFGGGHGLFSRKGLAEAWGRLGRTTRSAIRLVVIRPAEASCG
jgi:hypothetical protein